MPFFRRHCSVLTCVVILGLGACAVHRQYRDDLQPCQAAGTLADGRCPLSSVQQLQSPAGEDYLLGFVEFDDQGQLWSREQMDRVMRTLHNEAERSDMLMLVFVHGWHHSAAPGDGNIHTFRRVLARLAEDERYISRAAGQAPRKVVGVYLGWRGGSVPVPLLQYLTFWDRKSTATKVGKGAVIEVLTRIEQLQREQDRRSSGSGTRLIVVGHSFGGLIVHNALNQLLQARFVRNQGLDGQPGEVEGFGNLVVLINPAFEALQFAPLSDMANDRRHYLASQLPVLAVLTSEADYATRYAFPFGRSFNTMFERTRDAVRINPVSGEKALVDQGEANNLAVGHFEPFRTHRLFPLTNEPEARKTVTSSRDSVQSALAAARAWQADAPGSRIAFSGLMLERNSASVGRNPYLLVRVDKRLIADHNDIDDERVIEFIKQLVLISSVPQDRQGVLRRSLGVD